jgi:outer membrane receptor protein involved in Fe transport
MQRGRVARYAVAVALVCSPGVRAAEPDQLAQTAAEAEVQQAPRKGEQAKTAKATELDELVVEAKKPLSSASSDEVREKDYAVRPHDTMIELLNNIPGLVAAQHQGGGKAPQWLIRGFDADHGTDFAVYLDNMPVNLPTHAHGQGYADVNFIIPETLERFQLYKGPYFTQFGDFANAGALNFVTKEEFKENFAFAEGGSFDTQRYVVGASPKLSWAKTLLAGQVYSSNGPFVNAQNYWRYNVFGKMTLDLTPESKLWFDGSVYNGDWDGSGQIPLRVVQQGSLVTNPDVTPPTSRPFGRFDSIDPTEGGKTDREALDVHYTYTPSVEDVWSFQAYAARYKLQLFSDFTLFRDTGVRFVKNADGSITDTCRGVAENADCPFNANATYVPGDGIEQNDQRETYGGRANYMHYWLLGGLAGQSQVAVETRNDDINVALHRQVERARFYTINEMSVQEDTVSAWMQHQVFLTDWLRVEAGLRGDVFFFDGSNRLPNTVSTDPNCNPAADPTCDRNFTAVFIAGNSTNSIVSPKANVVLTPLPETDIYLNYGNGFHSNDARNVLLAKADPVAAGNMSAALAKSTGYELGARTRQFDRLDLATSLWLLDLSSELVFSGDAGGFQPAGATRRWGVDFETRYQFTRWLCFDYDLSYADARFRTEVPGGAVPLAPTLLMNGGLTTDFSNGFSAGFRMRYLGDRPANEMRTVTARGYALFDLVGRYRWRNVEAQLSFLNLTNTDWREAQFDDQSCVRGEVGPNGNDAACAQRSPQKQGGPVSNAGVDGIHFTPGSPFWARGGVAVYF